MPGRFGQRRDWFASQLDLNPAKLVFVDETGASTSLARKHGRCRRGRRLRAPVPQACADIFKSAECTNYFAACGYDTT